MRHSLTMLIFVSAAPTRSLTSFFTVQASVRMAPYCRMHFQQKEAHMNIHRNIFAALAIAAITSPACTPC